ncbi:AAA domain-containing protein [Streptomyces sp. NPDC008092]|uniref:AAA domain-containing protein n=1 Tax=Streptomyces sp. NPDC008092 TaxID=3364808 RepID=UPI0036E10E6C
MAVVQLSVLLLWPEGDGRGVGWREEITTAVEAWLALEGGAGRNASWTRVGRAVRTGESGVFTVDVRGNDTAADQVESLRLAGPEEPSGDSGHAVLDATQSGSALTVRVAEFAEPPDPYLWIFKQPPTFLVEALRDRFRTLQDAPLAALLAEGRPGGAPAAVPAPAGLLPAQQEVYRACLGSGVWLVWGPPGTGKTMVLTKAIGDLIASGRHVLLVSATNIAVDNALMGVVRERRHSAGDVVRVGPPHLREVAENPEVSLPLIVRGRLAEVDAELTSKARQLAEAGARGRQLEALESRLAGFDAAAHARARATLEGAGGGVAAFEARLDALRRAERETAVTVRQAEGDREAAQRGVDESEPADRVWQRVDGLRAEAGRLDSAATRAEATALLAGQEAQQAREALAELEAGNRRARWRSKKQITTGRTDLEEAERQYVAAATTARDSRRVADRRARELLAEADGLERTVPYTRERIEERRRRLGETTAAVGAARRALEDVESRRQQAEATRESVEAAQQLVDTAESHGHAKLEAQAQLLRPAAARDREARPALEQRYKAVQAEYERLARDAQGEVIAGARLVATTLARFRTNKHVYEKQYDVVLVDEAGAATAPEVILASGRARTAAVLLGDFMQLGAVLSPAIEESERSDVRRWLQPDIFQLCGIDDPASAHAHPGCITLVEQNRFGHSVMDLANSIAYDGTLISGQLVRSRGSDEAEIVLVDTDGIGEIGVPQRMSAASGWWPAGALLARALVELHRDDGEAAGVVTPYRYQEAATLEALRDVEGVGGRSGVPLAEVGTAHRFQGREFPVVVFDTVESQAGRAMWMAQASRAEDAGRWRRNGVRLFNVAITRVQHRLYIVGSRERILACGRRPELALGAVGRMLDEKRLRTVRATALVAPQSAPEAAELLGPFGSRLADVLSRHVEITDVDDEAEFYDTFVRVLGAARSSIWLWAPWVKKRVRSLLPVLYAARQRGVHVTVFVRDPFDDLQRKSPELVDELKEVADTVVRMNVMHQKIVVVDDSTVMIGSLNALSQSWTREIMITMNGGHFARKILEQQHAAEFSRPPTCPSCRHDDIEIRRGQRGNWYWRCYNRDCPHGTGNRAWKRDIVVGRRGAKRR